MIARLLSPRLKKAIGYHLYRFGYWLNYGPVDVTYEEDLEQEPRKILYVIRHTSYPDTPPLDRYYRKGTMFIANKKRFEEVFSKTWLRRLVYKWYVNEAIIDAFSHEVSGLVTGKSKQYDNCDIVLAPEGKITENGAPFMVERGLAFLIARGDRKIVLVSFRHNRASIGLEERGFAWKSVIDEPIKLRFRKEIHYSVQEGESKTESNRRIQEALYNDLVWDYIDIHTRGRTLKSIVHGTLRHSLHELHHSGQLGIHHGKLLLQNAKRWESFMRSQGIKDEVIVFDSNGSFWLMVILTWAILNESSVVIVGHGVPEEERNQAISNLGSNGYWSSDQKSADKLSDALYNLPVYYHQVTEKTKGTEKRHPLLGFLRVNGIINWESAEGLLKTAYSTYALSGIPFNAKLGCTISCREYLGVLYQIIYPLVHYLSTINLSSGVSSGLTRKARVYSHRHGNILVCYEEHWKNYFKAQDGIYLNYTINAFLYREEDACNQGGMEKYDEGHQLACYYSSVSGKPTTIESPFTKTLRKMSRYDKKDS